MSEKLQEVPPLERAMAILRKYGRLYDLACQPSGQPGPVEKSEDDPILSYADAFEKAIEEMDEEEGRAFANHLSSIAEKYGSGGP